MKTFIKITTVLSLIILISSCVKEDIKTLEKEKFDIVKIYAEDGNCKQTQSTPKK